MDKKNKSAGRLLNDMVLVLLLLAIALVLALIFFLGRREGSQVVVIHDGEEYARYSLSIDRIVVIDPDNDGKNTNTLVIHDGEAYVSEADCPDKICKAHFHISSTGESIVCLPHKLFIKIHDKTAE